MIKKTLTTIIMSGALITSGYLFSIDNSTIENDMLVYPDQNEVVAIQSNVNETDNIIEEFIITNVDNGVISGELLNGSGEGIYYELNELDKKDSSNETYKVFSKLDVNDNVRIEWTKESYDNNEWNTIERVTYNKNGNRNESLVAGVNE